MEQARYWMCTKRKHDFSTHHDHVLSSSHPSSSFGDSWEEQAFAEDAAGPLGGCIWPPRSYSCSFCRREFKSAQALGGHMNVHRRDRARLKQSPSPHREGEVLLQNPHILNPCTSVQYSPKICTYLYKRNSDSDQEVLTSPIRVSAPPTSTKIDSESEDKTTTFSVPAPLFTSIIPDEVRKKNVTTEQSWSNFVGGKCFRHVSDSKNNNEDKKSTTTCKSSSESNLSVSLNLLVCRTQRSPSDGDKETSPTSKRRKLIDASSFTLFTKSSTPADHQRCHLSHSSEVVLKNSAPSSMEDLDLELRLGDPPKVK